MKRKAVKKVISKEVASELKLRNIDIKYKNNGRGTTTKYSKEFHLAYVAGYDLLENLIVARPYIQKMYKIDICLFEILLFLAPRQYFTQSEYALMPKQYKYCLMQNLIDTGYFSIIQQGRSMSETLYRVNTKGLSLVRHFYEVLSGERKFVDNTFNPMTKVKTATAFDKKKMNLIRKINQLPAPDKKKPLYR